MEVDYLLFHEDHTQVDRMMATLQQNGRFLFDTAWRRQFGLSTVSQTFMPHEHTWYDVRVRGFSREQGTNVVHYQVTLPVTYDYPEFVAAALIEKDWHVKVRYRHSGDPWTYIQSEFPLGTTYTLPADWHASYERA
jgi:hypothetical protein